MAENYRLRNFSKQVLPECNASPKRRLPKKARWECS